MDKLNYDWKSNFDDRQLKEIMWAELYASLDSDGKPIFQHGTNGHNDLLIIARMAYLLNQFRDALMDKE